MQMTARPGAFSFEPHFASVQAHTPPPRRLRCQCFKLCTPEDAAAFWMQLPIMMSASSPWARYLRRVYGSEWDLFPFDLSTLELVYPALLPAAPCNRREALRTPRCETCDSWLPTAQHPPAPSAIAARASNSSFIRTPEFVILQPRIGRRAARNHTWIEVIRRESPFGTYFGQPLFPEGSARYGCWLLRARGSGVYVNVGRTLALRARSDAFAAGFGHGLGRRAQRPRYPGDDLHFASHTAARGFDSLQTLFGNPSPLGAKSGVPAYELVLTATGCMDRPTPIAGGCVPVPLRTGWSASRPCAPCNESANDFAVLNCAG